MLSRIKNGECTKCIYLCVRGLYK